MLAAFVKGHQVVLEDAPTPVLQDDSDVLLRVTATAICTSDVHFTEGFLPPCPPWVIGHEFTGVVEEAGRAVTAFRPGDRVVAPPVPYCGRCENCRQGLEGYCENSALLGSGASFGGLSGGLAEYVRVPNADSALVKIPDAISDEQAVFVADMLTTGYFAVSRCDLTPGDTLAVIGAGPVGLCAVHVARLYTPSKIILIGRRANRLKIGLEMGATDIIDADSDDVVAQVLELTDGRGVRAVIETVGTPTAVSTAAAIARLRGILALVGFYPSDAFEFPMQSVYMKSLTVTGGLMQVTNMPAVLDLISAGKLDPMPLLTHRMPLSKFEDAFSIFAEKKDDVLKVVLTP